MNASPIVAGVSSAPASAVPKRRKNVPYSGPLAPPTLLTSVIPAFFISSSTDPKLVSSSTATIAWNPRSMLAP